MPRKNIQNLESMKFWLANNPNNRINMEKIKLRSIALYASFFQLCGALYAVNTDTIKALAQAYIEHYSNPTYWDKDMVLTKRDNSSTEWAIDKVFDIAYENPEELWDLILEI
jgi:hypothetical protein